MRLMVAQALALPALLAVAVAAAALHQAGGPASVFASGGATVYQAEVVGTQTAAQPARGALHTIGAASGVLPKPPAGVTMPPATAQDATGDFAVQGGPSVTPAIIDRVLATYGSPMAGEGKQIYHLGVKYGIDPAFCLAFFVNESAAGTRGEAVLTHNLGNIRAVAGAPSLDGYRYYDTWLEGAEDWYRLISNVYVQQWGLRTVPAIIPVYAPSGDSNDPAAYISTVERLVTTWRAQG